MVSPDALTASERLRVELGHPFTIEVELGVADRVAVPEPMLVMVYVPDSDPLQVKPSTAIEYEPEEIWPEPFAVIGPYPATGALDEAETPANSKL
jgi:hypothetical protein